ncbi:MAG: 3-hydroxyacyl-ACP dehydratase FabZ [Acidobacteria bacterium]|nr:3-hydroxyacyl-ACP dehydratase FabZ [Acidobacteriota bacterium]
MAALPHRYPFLLVDRVIEHVPGERLVAIKNVTINEPFFNGHFPGNPVMPGVLIVEAMAQAGALLVKGSQHGGASLADKYLYLAGVDKARFRRPVVPGDQLRLEAETKAIRSTSCKMVGRAYVGDELAASAELLSMIVDGPSEDA